MLILCDVHFPLPPGDARSHMHAHTCTHTLTHAYSPTLTPTQMITATRLVIQTSYNGVVVTMPMRNPLFLFTEQKASASVTWRNVPPMLRYVYNL